MFHLTMHSTHFIYGYMVSGHIVKDHSDSEKRGNPLPLRGLLFPITSNWILFLNSKSATEYSFRLAARVLLYAPSYRQDSTYHSLCYSSRGALAGMRNSAMGPP